MTLVESLRMEARTADIAAKSGAGSSDFLEGMASLAFKFGAAADALEQHLREWAFLRNLVEERDRFGFSRDIPTWLVLEWIDDLSSRVKT